jgi:hypothetical protein
VREMSCCSQCGVAPIAGGTHDDTTRTGDAQAGLELARRQVNSLEHSNALLAIETAQSIALTASSPTKADSGPNESPWQAPNVL